MTKFKLNFRHAVILAAIFFVAGYNVKTYAQPTITIDATNADAVNKAVAKYFADIDNPGGIFSQPFHAVVTGNIGEGAFAFPYWQTGMMNMGGGPISVTGATSIGDGAFANLAKLTTVDCPNVSNVGVGAFHNCLALTTVNLPNVKTIGKNAFMKCKALSSVNIPNVATIVESAFDDCTALKSVTASTAKTIENAVFRNCINLVSIDATKVETIGRGAFYDCKKLKEAHFPELTMLEDITFCGCESLEVIDLPKVEGRINETMFADCYEIKTVDLSSASTIGANTFKDREKLETLKIDEAETIEKSAFENCHALPKANCPKVKTMGESAFMNCSALEEVEMPKVETLGESAFELCEKLATISVCDKLETIGKKAFKFCGELKNINGKFPKVKTVEEQAFYECNNRSFLGTKVGYDVIDLELPEVTYIGKEAFAHCGTAMSLGLFKNELSKLITIKERAFFNCPFIVTVSLPQVREIGADAFRKTNIWAVRLGTGFTSPTTITVVGDPFYGNGIYGSKSLNITTEVRPFYEKQGYVCMWNGTKWNQIGVIGAIAPCGSVFEAELQLQKSRAFRKEDNDWATDVTRKRDEYLRNNVNPKNDDPRGIDIVPDGENAPQVLKSKSDDIPTLHIAPETFKKDEIVAYITSSMKTNIGANAFEDCFFLQEVNFPLIGSNGIGNNAFKGCYFLRKVTLGTGYTEPTTINLTANSSDNRSFERTDSIDLVIGENVLPKHVGNTWNSYTWKSINIGTVGIKEVIEDETVKVYPNPAKDVLRVECNRPVVIALYDMTGIEVLSRSVSGNTEIKINHLPNGIYMMNVLADGKIIENSKIVKQ